MGEYQQATLPGFPTPREIRKPPFPGHELLRIGDIAGSYYACEQDKPSDTLIIYGIGAPRTPDFGDLPDRDVIRSHGVDIFVPDYIGFGRSDGEFTPQNCIDTFTTLFDAFTNGCEGKNTYSETAKQMQYKRIIIVGRSLGGTYVPLLPRFDPRIKEVAILCPVVDSKSQDKIPDIKEESNTTFMDSMRRDGYHHLYRGIVGQHEQLWENHLENRDDLSPMDNMQYLNGVKLFIGHGTKDDVVHYSKSKAYYDRLRETFPDQQDNFKLEIIPDGGHDGSTTNPAMESFLTWLGL